MRVVRSWRADPCDLGCRRSRPALVAGHRRMATRAGDTACVTRPASIGPMNYELFMGEALAEAQLAAAPRRAAERRGRRRRRGDGRPGPRPGRRRRTTRPPTRSSSPCARRPASSGATRLADATIFATQEPCAMCVGALLESDVEALVYAAPEPDRRRRRHGHPARPARRPAAPDQGRQRDPPRRGRGAAAPSAPRRPAARGRTTGVDPAAGAVRIGRRGPLVSSPAERCPSG